MSGLYFRKAMAIAEWIRDRELDWWRESQPEASEVARMRGGSLTMAVEVSLSQRRQPFCLSVYKTCVSQFHIDQCLCDCHRSEHMQNAEYLLTNTINITTLTSQIGRCVIS